MNANYTTSLPARFAAFAVALVDQRGGSGQHRGRHAAAQ